MLRFKLFSGPRAGIESEINQWLAEYDPDVTKMLQSVDGNGGVTITFLFDESFRGQELRLSEEQEAGRTRLVEPGSAPLDDAIVVPVEPGT